MKKINSLLVITFLSLLTIAGLMSCSTTKQIPTAQKVTGIDIVFSGDQVADSVYVISAPIPTDTTLTLLEYLEATRSGEAITYSIKDKAIHIDLDTIPSVYNINCDFYKLPPVYVRAEDHVVIEVSNLSPLKYKISHIGNETTTPHKDEFYDLRSKLYKISRYKLSDEELDSLSNKMYDLIDTIMADSTLRLPHGLLQCLRMTLLLTHFNAYRKDRKKHCITPMSVRCETRDLMQKDKRKWWRNQ